MDKYLFWLGADAETVAAWAETELQRVIESAPVVDLTGAESDE